MKPLFYLFLVLISAPAYGQSSAKLTTMEFVQVLNDNREEARYYYLNNWKVLREMAQEQGYIHSYQLLEVEPAESKPHQLILITTYQNEEQYRAREEHFSELINKKGALKLLNEKQPAEFRKTLRVLEPIDHWE